MSKVLELIGRVLCFFHIHKYAVVIQKCVKKNSYHENNKQVCVRCGVER